MSSLERAAARYVEALAELKTIRRELASCDDRGMADLQCTADLRDKGAPVACRKWRYEQYDPCGNVVWVSHVEDRSAWCPSCERVQQLVDQRRAARRRRGHALTAIANAARANKEKEAGRG